MSRIQQLSTQIANMIAAGEVVERPMGVVKELVENAIDAGSTRIIVNITGGGIDALSVEDNGCGMDAQDARNAFLRHATSKIHEQNDLWNIHTLGFRGEALPSIASVSKLTMDTSDGEQSTKVVMEYGKEVVYEPSACPDGTKITVEGLFYRTPARLKHLRSASYEASLIQNVISSFALSHPEIAFRLFTDGRETFRTNGNNNLLEVIYQVYGRQPAESAIRAQFSDFDYTVDGYLISPVFTRANRNFIHIFLNGRMVKDNRLYRAVQEGYSGMLPQGRYPMCVLHITMDPHILDVNVHPGKWEVRLSKERQLDYLLVDNIGKLLKMTPVVKKEEPKPVTPVYYQPVSFTKEEMAPAHIEEKQPVYDEVGSDEALLASLWEEKPKETKKEETVVEEERIPFPACRILGQVHEKYIVAECEAGLMVLDLKGAMQRTAYEALLREMENNHATMQCLVPITIHAATGAVVRIDALNAAVADMGIRYEPFGEDTLVVHEIPCWMKDGNEEQILTDIVDNFLQDKKDTKEKMAFRRLVAKTYASTRKVVKMMDVQELEALVNNLSSCDNPWTAPDGKPLVAILDERTLARNFI